MIRTPALSLLFFLSLVMLSGCAGGGKSAAPGPAERAAMEGALGVEAYRRGDLDVALWRFEESLRIHRSTDSRALEVVDLLNIGRTHTARGEFTLAKTRLEEAVRLSRGLTGEGAPQAGGADAEKLLPGALVSLARARYMAGDTQGALDNIKESLTIVSEDDDGGVLGPALNLKALILMDSGRIGEAKEALARAFDINSDAGDAGEFANTLRAASELELSEGDLEKAMALAARAYSLDRTIGDGAKIALDLRTMAGVRKGQGRTREAVFLLERSCLVSVGAGLGSGAVDCLDQLIEELRGLGEAERALYYTGIRERLSGKTSEEPR